MRFQHAIILAILYAALSPCGRSFASSDVLLPNPNGNNGSLPNLGLMPEESAPEPAPPPKPAPTPQPDKAPATQPAILPAASAPANPTPPVYTPPAAPQAAAPYSLTVSLAQNSLWTTNDLSNVSAQLGIAKSQVMSECRTGINGMIVTDRGTYPVESNATASTSVSFAGMITNTMLSTYALCASAPKPAPYAYVQKVGNQFLVPLGSAFCSPSASSAGTLRRILLTHTPNGNDSCSYGP